MQTTPSSSMFVCIHFTAPLHFSTWNLIVFDDKVFVVFYAFFPVGIGSGVSFQMNNNQKFNIVTLYSTTR